MAAKSDDQSPLPPPTPMQRFPLLDFPVDILFLILYELSVEDLVSLASVPSIAPIEWHLRVLIRLPIDLQDFLLHL